METSETSPAAPVRKTPKRHTYNPKAVKPPKSAKGPMKLISTLATSAVAVLIILFAMGKLPMVDAFWANINQSVQSHNEEAIAFFIRVAPVALFCVGGVGLVWMLKPSGKGKSA